MIAGRGGIVCGFVNKALHLAEEGTGDNELKNSSIFDIMSLMVLFLARGVCFSAEFCLMMAAVLCRSAESSRFTKEILFMRTTVE